MTLLLATIISLHLGGCSNEVNFPGNEAGKEAVVFTSNSVSIPIEKIRTLNPLLSKDEDAYYLNRLIYQSLFRLNSELAAEGELADRYEYLENGDLVLYLKENIMWEDGTSFTANDVKFSIDAYSAVPSNKQGTYSSIVSSIKSSKVVDTYTLQIQFVDINNSSLENLTFPVLPSHTYKKVADLIKDEDDFVPTGSGPYKIEGIEKGKMITLAGNEMYYGEIPENTINFIFIPKKEDALNLFDIGELNMTYLRNVDRDTLVENKSANITSFTSNEVEVLGFNFNHGAMQNIDIRHAIALSIDKLMILETCYFNSGIIHDTIYYPGYMGLEDLGKTYDYDPTRAAALLKASGYDGLSLDLIYNYENHSRKLAAQMIKGSLEKIGIAVDVIPLESEDYNLRLEKGDFDLYIGGFKFNESYDLRPVLYTDGDFNFVNYSNPQMDKLLDKMQQGIFSQDKRKTYEKLNELYIREMPYYCLLYKTFGFISSKDLAGSIEPHFYDIYNGCESWQIVRQDT